MRRTTNLLLLLLLGLALGRPATAQDGDNRAGLLVQFGADAIQTACVDLGPDGQATGEEVLRAAGLNAIIDYSTGMGGTVCKIGDQGCNFPAQACFCQCSMQPGDPCVYWVYFHLLDGQWRYAIQGANSYTVRPGDVEGWVWGLGSASGGTQPPVMTFEQICGEAPAATAPAPTVATTAVPPTQPPTEPVATLPAATQAPATQAPATQTLALTASPSSPPASTAPPVLTRTSTLALTRTATLALTGTATPAAAGSATPAATTIPSSTAPPTGTVAPAPSATATPEASPTPAAVAAAPDAAETADEQPAAATAPGTAGYILFGVLVLALVAGLVILQVRQRR